MKFTSINFIILAGGFLSFFLAIIGFFAINYVDESISECNDNEIQSTLYYQRYKNQIKCWSKKTYEKIVYYWIDALRYDVAFEDKPGEGFNCLPTMKSLGDEHTSKRFHFIAHAPTGTAQRAKAMFTGIIPYFIEIISSFNSVNVKEDSVFKQIALNDGYTDFAGDKTAVKAFGNYFREVHSSKPYNVFEHHESDELIHDHYEEYITKNKNDMVLLHTVGMDHSSHSVNTYNHSIVCEKLQNNDFQLKKIHDILPPKTLLFCGGDHGMTNKAFHSGFTSEEIDSALLLHSNIGLGESTNDAINQIDIVPTISLSLGLPVPYSNLGVPIRSVFIIDQNNLTQVQDYVNALNVTSIQMLRWWGSKPKNNDLENWYEEYIKRTRKMQDDEIKYFDNIEKLRELCDKHEILLYEPQDLFYNTLPYNRLNVTFSYLSFGFCILLIIFSYFDVNIEFLKKHLHIITTLIVVMTILLYITNKNLNIFNSCFVSILFIPLCYFAVEYGKSFLKNVIHEKTIKFLENNILFISSLCYSVILIILHLTISSVNDMFTIDFVISQLLLLIIGVSTLMKKKNTETVETARPTPIYSNNLDSTPDYSNDIYTMSLYSKDVKQSNDVTLSSSASLDLVSSSSSIDFGDDELTHARNIEETLEEELIEENNEKILEKGFEMFSIAKTLNKKLNNFLNEKYSLLICCISIVVLNIILKSLGEIKSFSIPFVVICLILHLMFKCITIVDDRKTLTLHCFQTLLLIFILCVFPDSYFPLVLYLTLPLSILNFECLVTSAFLINSLLQPSYVFHLLIQDVFFYITRKTKSPLLPLYYSTNSMWLYRLFGHGYQFNDIHFNIGFIGVKSFFFLLNAAIICFNLFFFQVLPMIQSIISHGFRGGYVHYLIMCVKCFIPFFYFIFPKYLLAEKWDILQLTMFNWLYGVTTIGIFSGLLMIFTFSFVILKKRIFI